MAAVFGSPEVVVDGLLQRVGRGFHRHLLLPIYPGRERER
jgi:hypothetical protein